MQSAARQMFKEIGNLSENKSTAKDLTHLAFLILMKGSD
jgi:hypothetical protein